MTSLPRYWYSIVSALPDPEVGESVVVGLVVGIERWARLEFVEELPKLACLVSSDDLRIYRTILGQVQHRIRNAEDLFGLGPVMGPHFQLSVARELFQAPEGATLRRLKNRYLKLQKSGKARGSRFSAQVAASGRLDAALSNALPFGASLEKMATMDRLYPEAAAAGIFSTPVPRLNRAIRMGSVDVLIGSVVVDQADPLSAAREASARISQAFWQYQHGREAVRDVTGRELRTLGVVLNGTSHERPEVADAKKFVLHLWDGEADRLFAPERREDETALAKQVAELAV